MQRHRSIFDTFPDNVDLNQGPNFNNRNVNEPDEFNNRLSPTERRLLSNELSSELNFSRVNTTDHHNANQRFSNWDAGESSSRAIPQDPIFGGSNGNNGSLRSDTNHLPMDVDLNLDYGGSFGSAHEMEASSSGTSDERGPDCSFGNWGLSCKRKTLEGSGSSSRFPEAENMTWNSHSNNHGLMVNNNNNTSRESVHAVSGVTFPPSTGVPESSSRRYYRDSSSVNISANGNPGSSSNSRGAIWSPTNLNHHNSSNVQPQPPVVQAPGIPRNLLPFPPIPREVNNSEANFRSSFRHNEQNRYFGPSNETRNAVQDPNSLSLGFGRASGNSRNETGSRANGIWTPRVNPTTQSQQRVSDLPPWTLFPPSDSESGSGGHRGHFSFFPLESSSSRNSEENTNGQGRNGQPFSRSSLMEVPGDEWQAFAADIEGRHRLVSEMRQILNVLRRGELRAEDYMLFDPFINGVAELDRHRDMRLDVDNMSYEELLALEERIGDVKTGLTEEVILRTMKQRKHIAFLDKWNQNLEPCCICREEYHNGDDIGVLDCGHDFHTCCIKQWLSQKNLCPICKMPGLSTT